MSFKRHNKALQLEFKKARMNHQVINELMSISFGLRRKDILVNPQDLQITLTVYPFLGIPEQVLCLCECFKTLYILF